MERSMQIEIDTIGNSKFCHYDNHLPCQAPGDMFKDFYVESLVIV